MANATHRLVFACTLALFSACKDDVDRSYELVPSAWVGQSSRDGKTAGFVLAVTRVGEGNLAGHIDWDGGSRLSLGGTVDGNHVVFKGTEVIISGASDDPAGLLSTETSRDVSIVDEVMTGKGSDGSELKAIRIWRGAGPGSLGPYIKRLVACQLAGGDLARCYGRVAATTGNPDLCTRFSGEDLATCQVNLARESGQWGHCSAIAGSAGQASCYLEAATASGQQAACDAASEVASDEMVVLCGALASAQAGRCMTLGTTDMTRCIESLAVRKKNPKLCQKLGRKSRGPCLLAAASASEKKATCNLVRGKARAACRDAHRLRRAPQSPKGCKGVRDEDVRDQCYIRAAAALQGGGKFCKSVQDPRRRKACALLLK